MRKEKIVKTNFAHVACRLPSEGRINTLKLPGMRLILLGLVIFFFVGIRKVLFYWGIPLPLRSISQFGGILASVLLFWGIRKYSCITRTHQKIYRLHQQKVYFWHGLLVLFFVVGLLNGNSWNIAGKEFIMLWFFGEFWIIGANDRFWYALEKPLTIIFYIAAPLIFLYYTTPAIITDILGSEQLDLKYLSNRYINTLGYDLKPLIGSGMFLFVWGTMRPRHDYWRVLQIGALFISFTINVGLFKFRGVAFSYAAIGLVMLLLRPVFEKRKRPGTSALLLSAGLVGLWIFTQTDAFAMLMDRMFTDTKFEPLFESRNNELSAYIDDMGWQVFVGRGLGGSYDAYNAISILSAHNWTTTHFGILVFTLKGGILMLGAFLAVLLAGFKLRPKDWYQNPMNLTATLLLPVLTLNFFLNPFSLTPDAVFTYLPFMMVLARFGRKTNIDVSFNYTRNRIEQSIQPHVFSRTI